ncbi:helix-turn-helix transcriptional regulator (plasmid) [Streptomyces buecherae]|uniref:Helix-turn-helix transcriptional regulator n=2 Tax=Streptomyces buecherae TaxID=2763006 RepID=A0A7H8NKF6_9ACTN|nr:helix-turn-helix transcriptional regulator [Streptomyces buecherae]
MFAGVEDLLALATGTDLPPPAERARLRRAAGLSQEQVARALGLKRAVTVSDWERGTSEPRPPRRTAYARLLAGLAERFPATPAAEPPATPPAATPTAPAPAPASAPARAPRRASSAPPPRRRATPKPAPAPAPVASVTPDRGRYAHGPLAVLDADGTAYAADGQILECPATTLTALVEWTLTQTQLGAERLHRWGKDADPLVVLTAGATERLGLPDHVDDIRSADGGPRLPRLPDDHPAIAQLAADGWQLTRRGFGPWPRIYRPVSDGGRRQCVQFAILPWGALEERSWPGAADLDPAALAHALTAYADRVITPRTTTAVAGLELMTALRPPTRPVKAADGSWTSGPVTGSLTTPVDCAPPEAPPGHPLALESGQGLREEASDWARDPQTLTDEECAHPYAIGLDTNLAFLAASNRLSIGLGAPEHVTQPRFNKKISGSWYVDLSGAPHDPRLPSPFTPDGQPPTGPAWYSTPTVAYAVELGVDIHPEQAWLRPGTGAYLDPWYLRLRDAYLATMADLGVTRDQDDEAFLAAMRTHKSADPAQAAVLAAIKATAKGGIGKLRETAKGASWRPGERWPALERPTWRPDIAAAVIATARVNLHRRMRRMAEHDRFPLAVLSDCVVYPAATDIPTSGPTAAHLLPTDRDGAPISGTFRLGVAPGRVKHEGTQPFLWAAEQLDAGSNPARYIKGGHDAVLDGGE